MSGAGLTSYMKGSVYSFCFVCGLLGHQERDCAIIYANPDKEIIRAYGGWLMASIKNAKNMNLGAKWLRNGSDSNRAWDEGASNVRKETVMQESKMVDARFMKVDGIISENQGETGGIKVVPRNQKSSLDNNTIGDQLADKVGGGNLEKNMVILESKSKRVEQNNIMGYDNKELLNGLVNSDGTKNLIEVLWYMPA